MTYVITEPCVDVKRGLCVDVCPAGCIHTTPDARQHFIDPEVCIECEQCVLVCPVNAIFLDAEVPDEWRPFIQINADFFRANKAVERLSAEQAESMVQAAQRYAARAGLAVAVQVVDRLGQPLAGGAMEGCALGVLDRAAQKAYTALVYQVPTHEVRPGATPPWLHQDATPERERLLVAGGGFPVAAGNDILGAVGVAGGPSPEHDIMCCQAALGVRGSRH